MLGPENFDIRFCVNFDPYDQNIFKGDCFLDSVSAQIWHSWAIWALVKQVVYNVFLN